MNINNSYNRNMTRSPHSRSHHRLSLSFADSAIDVELPSEQSTQSERNFPLASPEKDHVNYNVSSSSPHSSFAERFSHIAHLAATADYAARAFSETDHAAISKCLNELETLFGDDPRSEISRIITLNRPSSSSSNSRDSCNSNSNNNNRSPTPQPPSQRTVTPKPDLTTTTTTTTISTPPKAKDTSPSSSTLPNLKIQSTTERQQQQQASDSLKFVLQELSSVNAELQQRCLESRHIHDVFIMKCEGLAQRIIELENEIHELKSDILEDTIELEGLRGTIRGLESWVGRWQRQRVSSSTSTAARERSTKKHNKKKNSWGWATTKTKKLQQSTMDREGNCDDEEGDDNDGENDFDTFLDGVLAWMRGWNDVEEGFLVRARRRKMRRDLKALSSSSG